MKETFYWAFFIRNLPKLIGAIPVTLQIMGLALLFGWAGGLLIVFGKLRGRWTGRLLTAMTDVIRCIPTVLLLFIVYFAVPGLLGSGAAARSRLPFVVAALAIEIAAVSSEMFRSAFLSIDRRQMEAARALGFAPIQVLGRVIIPQGLRIIAPNLGSAVLAAMQATSMVYTLGILDVLGRARQIDSTVTNTKTLELMLGAALIYWALALIIDGLFGLLNRYLRSRGAVD